MFNLRLNPKKIAILFSGFIGLIYSALLFIIATVYNISIFYFWLISLPLLIILTYYLYYFTIKKFIYNKLSIIYKTIQNTTKFDLNKFDANVLEETERDVQKWAAVSSQQIEFLKKQESFRREFIGNVSHELKTPIFNIQGYISTLLDGALEDKNINRRYLERAEKSINRMITIVKDLDTISRLESGELDIKFEPFNIVQLTKEAIDLLDIKAKNKNIKIYFAQNYDSILVSGDKEQIRHVISNLLVNSINYGSLNGYTKISFNEIADKIITEVEDNGIGIEDMHLPRIFERFYRTDKGRSREEGGTGLGLAIVKHIIEAHQQNINVTSTFGKGTTFYFSLNKAK